jgi:hypothetical protein
MARDMVAIQAASVEDLAALGEGCPAEEVQAEAGNKKREQLTEYRKQMI